MFKSSYIHMKLELQVTSFVLWLDLQITSLVLWLDLQVTSLVLWLDLQVTSLVLWLVLQVTSLVLWLQGKNLIFGWANIIYFSARPAGDCKIFCRNPISLKLFISQDPNFFLISIKTVPKQKLNYQISVGKWER
jgi:hypothetical protein